MACMDDQVLAEIANELYAKPLDDFIAARAAAAKEAAGSDKELAAAVRGLPKPSVAAWAVNMLALHQPDVLAGLMDLGGRMREAQASLDAPALCWLPPSTPPARWPGNRAALSATRWQPTSRRPCAP